MDAISSNCNILAASALYGLHYGTVWAQMEDHIVSNEAAHLESLHVHLALSLDVMLSGETYFFNSSLLLPFAIGLLETIIPQDRVCHHLVISSGLYSL